MKKVTYDFQAFFFVLMAPAFGSIVIWGRHSGGGGRFKKSPRERDNYQLVYYIQQIL